MSLEHIRLAAKVAQRAGDGDDEARRNAYGAIFREVARHLRKGSFGHGAECLRLLKRGAPWIAAGRSQLFQDVWALYESGWKSGGFFVEFGAASGVTFSNTWLLEKQFGWSGILAEPNPAFRESLRENRACAIDFDCVWSRSGETLRFRCAETAEHSGVSTAAALVGEIEVATVSLNDLLLRHAAPPVIDYLSVDTEGSEFEILSAFDFGRWDVRLVSVEHNGREDRQALFDLMTRHGYRRRFTEISHYDDWYAKV